MQSQGAFPQVVAGGQTCLRRKGFGRQAGADRAALGWAIANRMPYGEWCPKGRKAEDGRIPDDYRLQETASADYPEQIQKRQLL